MFSEKLDIISNVDQSGSCTYQRFEYQIACVFLTFLTLYKNTNDFFILLDYIDDFVIVENHKTRNEIINFVQVKTKKDKPISISTVIKQEWILKQARNYKNFLDKKVKNILMTNLGISFKQKVISDTELVSLEKCNDYDYIDKLKEQVCDNDIKDLNNFYLLKASVTLEAFKQDLKGKMLEYVNDNNFTSLTAESIKTIYLKIWDDLTSKQSYIPNNQDTSNSEILINKKGVKYSYIKDIFKTMLEIQLPEEGKISDFCNKNNLYYDSKKTYEFIMLFKQFRVNFAKYGINVILEAFDSLNENKTVLNEYMKDTYLFSKKVFDIINDNQAINTSVFFKKYSICISIFYTYKAYNF